MSKGMGVSGPGLRRWMSEEIMTAGMVSEGMVSEEVLSEGMASEGMVNGGLLELEETSQASLYWFSGQNYSCNSISLLHLMLKFASDFF